MSTFWQDFWSNYRKADAKTEADLYYQVGKTVYKKPIPPHTLRLMVERIVAGLQLSSADHVLDLCCGNGLIDYELATHVRHVTGVDFARSLISTARQFKQRPNITYCLSDVSAPLPSFIGTNIVPNKFLMSDALAYFEPLEFDNILSNILRHFGHHSWRFLITHIPNSDLKWNFYNTPERIARHLKNEKRAANTNDGLGRWWRAEEIEAICLKHGLSLELINQPADLSNYRMDALIGSTR